MLNLSSFLLIMFVISAMERLASINVPKILKDLYLHFPVWFIFIAKFLVSVHVMCEISISC